MTDLKKKKATGVWAHTPRGKERYRAILGARGVNTLPITFNKWLPSIEAKSSLQALGPLSSTHLRGQSMDKLGQMLTCYTPGPQTCSQSADYSHVHPGPRVAHTTAVPTSAWPALSHAQLDITGVANANKSSQKAG